MPIVPLVPLSSLVSLLSFYCPADLAAPFTDLPLPSPTISSNTCATWQCRRRELAGLRRAGFAGRPCQARGDEAGQGQPEVSGQPGPQVRGETLIFTACPCGIASCSSGAFLSVSDRSSGGRHSVGHSGAYMNKPLAARGPAGFSSVSGLPLPFLDLPPPCPPPFNTCRSSLIHR